MQAECRFGLSLLRLNLSGGLHLVPHTLQRDITANFGGLNMNKSPLIRQLIARARDFSEVSSFEKRDGFVLFRFDRSFDAQKHDCNIKIIWLPGGSRYISQEDIPRHNHINPLTHIYARRSFGSRSGLWNQGLRNIV